MAKTAAKKPSSHARTASAASPGSAKGKVVGKNSPSPAKPASNLSAKAGVKPAKKIPKSVERPPLSAKSSTSVKSTPGAKVAINGKANDKSRPDAVPTIVMPARKASAVAARTAPVAPEAVVKPAPRQSTAMPKAAARVSDPAPQPAAPAKPRKPNAGFTARELDNFRDLLLAKRRELIGDMHSMEREALRSGGAANLSNLPIHMADMGTDNYEQEFTLGLVQKDRDLLREINTALMKMQSGLFGFCEGTGLPIGKARLEYQPWARFSVEHQRKLERHGR